MTHDRVELRPGGDRTEDGVLLERFALLRDGDRVGDHGHDLIVSVGRSAGARMRLEMSRSGRCWRGHARMSTRDISSRSAPGRTRADVPAVSGVTGAGAHHSCGNSSAAHRGRAGQLASLAALRRSTSTTRSDSVAARSGVARTTIYRRHRSRAKLMTAVLDELVQSPLPAPDLPVAEKLRWVLERVGDVLTHGLGSPTTCAP